MKSKPSFSVKRNRVASTRLGNLSALFPLHLTTLCIAILFSSCHSSTESDGKTNEPPKPHVLTPNKIDVDSLIKMQIAQTMTNIDEPILHLSRDLRDTVIRLVLHNSKYTSKIFRIYSVYNHSHGRNMYYYTSKFSPYLIPFDINNSFKPYALSRGRVSYEKWHLITKYLNQCSNELRKNSNERRDFSYVLEYSTKSDYFLSTNEVKILDSSCNKLISYIRDQIPIDSVNVLPSIRRKNSQ